MNADEINKALDETFEATKKTYQKLGLIEAYEILKNLYDFELTKLRESDNAERYRATVGILNRAMVIVEHHIGEVE